MTQQDLKDFKLLKKEIKLLETEIQQLGYETVTDTVRGSDREWPYIDHVITITGLDQKGYRKKVKYLTRRLKRRKETLQDKWVEVDKFIAGLDNSVDRQMITLRYVEGLKWEEVAAKMGSGYSVDSVKKAHERLLRKLEVVPNVTKK
jgi:DNA-directed RNA polymerase specialized sigma24 family protein